MKQFMTRALMAISLVAMAALATAGEHSAKQQLGELLDAFLAGASVNDSAIHQRFWSDDLVYTSSSGQRFGKSSIMEGIAAAERSGDETTGLVYSGRDVDIRVFDELAVITFTLVATEPSGDETRYYNTGVFRKADDQWRAIAWQATLASE